MRMDSAENSKYLTSQSGSTEIMSSAPGLSNHELDSRHSLSFEKRKKIDILNVFRSRLCRAFPPEKEVEKSTSTPRRTMIRCGAYLVLLSFLEDVSSLLDWGFPFSYNFKGITREMISVHTDNKGSHLIHQHESTSMTLIHR
ncbi:hypothetical protein PROFUN_11003 [Planoprotostelium fungivorum]|uniref:Uncharacterized protein n=1 Tax=Planoprotostelium fungivorum TaxID=1890364 RepID=A0A2P6NC10_9EUKA|nr:hypothetical protein PROFUN_11003 [Planoprotostelium fungivorum]